MALSITFWQLFSLFFFSVDSQGFIAWDFFSIASNKRGKRSAKRQFKGWSTENQRGKQERSIGGKYLRNLFTHSKNNHQHTRGNLKQATDVISALTTSVSCTEFTQLFQNMSSIKWFLLGFFSEKIYA
jgi:hypothetical protein